MFNQDKLQITTVRIKDLIYLRAEKQLKSQTLSLLCQQAVNKNPFTGVNRVTSAFISPASLTRGSRQISLARSISRRREIIYQVPSPGDKPYEGEL